MDDFSTCDHPVRVAGMCAICGIVLDDDPAQAHDRSSQQQLHDISGVQVSTAEAKRLDSESTRRLLSQRKLALIVDLDQTIIHATVDPTVGDWMKDEANPNFSALANVGKFLLGQDGKAVVDSEGNAVDETSDVAAAAAKDGCWYYVKPRPGLQSFLQQLSQRYEMYVYTMGTRTYAESVCKLVDPRGSFFGARILSRDENGSLVSKSLKKLFPMDTSMVIIIDDRADVWQWSPNLIRVAPFDFFVGIGDINATFLPTVASTAPLPSTEPIDSTADGTKGEDSSATANGTEESRSGSSSIGGRSSSAEEEARAKDDAAKTVADESQKSAVSEQLDARPLAKMQQVLDGNGSANGEKSANEGPHQPAAVLKETDAELLKIQEILDEVHAQWYAEYEDQGDSETKPAITNIIARLKMVVLEGCSILFSSVAPLQQDIQTTDAWRLATEFGARCRRTFDSSVTHVVTAKQGTEKTLAGHRKNLNVVWYQWLQDSCLHWTRQPERNYALPRPSQGQLERGQASFSSGQTAAATSGPQSDSYEHDGLGESGDEESGLGDDEVNEDEDEDEEEEDQDEDGGFDGLNWDEANDEVDAVLDGLTDDEDSATDGGYATDDSRAGRGASTKRLRSGTSSPSGTGADLGAIGRGDAASGDLDDGQSADEDQTRTGSTSALSPLSKRRRLVELRAGQSRLKEVMNIGNNGSRGTSAAPSEEMGTAASDKAPLISAEPPAAAANAGGAETQEPSVAGEAANEDGDEDSDFLHSFEQELELQLGADDED